VTWAGKAFSPQCECLSKSLAPLGSGSSECEGHQEGHWCEVRVHRTGAGQGLQGCVAAGPSQLQHTGSGGAGELVVSAQPQAEKPAQTRRRWAGLWTTGIEARALWEEKCLLSSNQKCAVTASGMAQVVEHLPGKA
jgi:hypothetical protein